MTNACRRCAVVLLGLAAVGLATGCTDDDPALESRQADRVTAATAPPAASDPDGIVVSGLVADDHLGSYRLRDPEFGTDVTVTVGGGVRVIETNALPNHATGVFPNAGNPNTISGQTLRYEFPSEPVALGRPTEARVPGVAVNGVPFEPGTAETMACASGETYRIEAIQGLYDLGLDGDNAHVQPTGTYHYHGLSGSLVAGAASTTETAETGSELTHVGFAADGFLILASAADDHRPGYRLATEPRTGSGCSYRGTTVDLDGTTPDGTYVSDWVYDDSIGDLDACNGASIDGEYVYLVTAGYPYVPRCLMGDFTDPGPGGSGPTGGGPGGGGSGPGRADGG